jgi:hypothetical protein
VDTLESSISLALYAPFSAQVLTEGQANFIIEQQMLLIEGHRQ